MAHSYQEIEMRMEELKKHIKRTIEIFSFMLIWSYLTLSIKWNLPMLTSTLTRAPGAKATRLELTWLVCWPWKRPKCWFSMNSPLWWIARLPNAWQKACKIFWIRGANLGLVELETCWVGRSDFFGMFLPLHRAFMLGLAIKMDRGRDMAELSQICSNLACFYSK